MSNVVKNLVLKSVKKIYGSSAKAGPVFESISCTFQRGKTYAIRGVSGSGKSTLLHLLGGLDTPTTGEVLLDDTSVASLGREFLQSTIGFVFQAHYLVNELPVIENIMLPGRAKGLSEVLCKKRAYALLQLIGLSDKAQAFPPELSGGQQQRVAVARALFNKPAFLLADEPTGNLDADNAQLVVDILLEANKLEGMGVVICSHDAAVYGRMEIVYVLEHGALLLDQSPK
ncbi:ABC transporter ATP-binding protein [Candidatus Dependentiae bacterium]|nr:ABC transporter ATP-binding protein [Candidatus Dependentiae bacterium]